MKTDLYTKAVLTIIAIALVCIVVQNSNIVTPIHATASPVLIANPIPQSTQDVNLWRHDLKESTALPVYIVENPNKKEVTEE